MTLMVSKSAIKQILIFLSFFLAISSLALAKTKAPSYDFKLDDGTPYRAEFKLEGELQMSGIQMQTVMSGWIDLTAAVLKLDDKKGANLKLSIQDFAIDANVPFIGELGFGLNAPLKGILNTPDFQNSKAMLFLIPSFYITFWMDKNGVSSDVHLFGPGGEIPIPEDASDQAFPEWAKEFQTAQQSPFIRLPDKPLRKGSSWQEPVPELILEVLGDNTLDMDHKLESVSKKKFSIVSNYNVKILGNKLNKVKIQELMNAVVEDAEKEAAAEKEEANSKETPDSKEAPDSREAIEKGFQKALEAADGAAATGTGSSHLEFSRSKGQLVHMNSSAQGDIQFAYTDPDTNMPLDIKMIFQITTNISVAKQKK